MLPSTLSLVALLAPSLPAQPPLACVQEDEPVLGETIVTATRSRTDPFETAHTTAVTDEETIDRRAYRTTPQILRDVPGVLVQETAQGQGSPYIRGLTGFRNVFLIDGIRLNNSVFRDGPNQYWSTVDPHSIERLELVKGPSAVLFGSDAMGGVVNAITHSPTSYGEGFASDGELYYRISSAENSHVVRAQSSLSTGEDLGLFVGVTGKDFGDVRGGDDVGTQENTGYEEWDADLKLERFLGDSTRFVAGLQQVKQNDVPRTHKTVAAEPFEGTSIGSDLRRDLDQERTLAYVQLHGEDLDGALDAYSISLSWHGQEESRDRVKGSGSRSNQGFEVDTLGLVAHASGDTAIGRLTFGADLYHDEVDSFSSSNPVQGPVADDASYDLAGIFVQDRIEVNDALDVTLGARISHAEADADSVLDPVSSLPFSLEDDWDAFVASARFLYRVSEERVNLFGGISQGFRAPNLSDLTRFDTARSNEFEIPSPDLDPEYTTTYELGLRSQGQDTSCEVSVFYTDVEDFIVRFPTGNVNADGEAEITKDNVGDGYVTGLELGGAWRFSRHWTLFGNGTWMDGEVETFPTSAPVIEKEPIDRLMPPTLQLGVSWEDLPAVHGGGMGRWFELVGRWADDADELSTRDAGDTSRIPPGGTPSYLVLSVRGGIRLSANTELSLALENLTNEDYRIHGSGLNMPGFGAIVGLTVHL